MEKEKKERKDTQMHKQGKDIVDQIVDQLDVAGMTQEELFGQGGLVKTLTSRLISKMLDAEMDSHLGYRKNSQEGDHTGNSRNGYSKKKIITGEQEAEIMVPRDRNGEFEPLVVPKYSKRLPLFNDQILSLYSRGMTTRDIQAHLKEIYEVDVSAELISNVTDSVLEDVRGWRNRPLDTVYPIVFLDALRINSRESGKNRNKALHVALGINMEGRKEILGFYLGDNEGARFWMGVLNDLKSRGVADIFIACMDGLTGFPEAVRAVYPNTRVQLCIVHMIRSSTKFVSYKDLRQVCGDLKEVYSASCEENALEALEEFGRKWDGKYSMIRKSWEGHWNDLGEFFGYPQELRKVIYTTNAIESLNFSLRKATKNRAAFPDDDSVYKIIYLATQKISKKWTQPIQNWGLLLNQLMVVFGDRVEL